MKRIMAAWSLILALSAYGQGTLAPLGSPSPNMKTLDQIEARTPLPPAGFNPATDFPITLSQSGSYYLTQDVTGATGKHGIVIDASQVTLDLNGFTLQGNPPPVVGGGGVDGISGPSAVNVVVRNGRIRGWTGRGVNLAAVAVVEDLNVENCGSDGIKVDQQGAVRRCRIGSCGFQTSGYGIAVQHLSVVENCNSVNNWSGILATYGCRVRDCSVTYSSRWGIRVGYENVIQGNLCATNGIGATDGAGILATEANNRIEDNQLLNADIGLHLQSTGNVVANNIVKGNAKNYNIGALLGKANQLDILLCQIPETIDFPCSIRLAGDLYLGSTASNGITVNADNVTIDLAGHALVGPGENSQSGIYQAAQWSNLRIINGQVVNWRGTDLAGLNVVGSHDQIENIQASSNHSGIRCGSGCKITGCTLALNTYSGITGFYYDAQVISGCVAYGNDRGITCGTDSIVSGCTSSSNSDLGIHANVGSTVSECVASHNGGSGIIATAKTRVIGNTCNDNGTSGSDSGIWVNSNGARIDGNCVNDNVNGISVPGSGNLVVRNTASGNTLDYSISGGNSAAQILTPGSGFVSTDPWANISF